MYVAYDEKKTELRYRLADYDDDGGLIYPYSYGKEQPTFYEPEFHHGVCENKLGDIPTGSVNLHRLTHGCEQSKHRYRY